LAWNLQLVSNYGETIMLDTNAVQLQIVADNTESIEPLANMVEHYTCEIEERRRQLSDDLAYFDAKLADLKELDPLDFAGLTTIYRKHASHIRGLLADIELRND
jgi:DNA repair ATPase RecN